MTSSRSSGKGARVPAAALVWLTVLVAVVALRVWAVWTGALFGTAQIVAVDVIIAALVALTFWSWALAGRDAGGTAGTWLDRVGGFAAVVALPALVTATLNLVAPATPPSLSVAACSGAQTWNTPYHGRTIGPLGNYARTGPGLSFPQSGRFKEDCSLGFVGYCAGDPVKEPFTKTWTDTRWLLLGSHRSGLAKWTARLSGEPEQPRFVALAYVAPNSPDRDLDYLGDKACAQGRPLPGKTTMTPAPKPDGTVGLTVASDNAERVGVALAVPADALRSGGPVRWVWSGAPGAAGPQWITARTANDLKPKRSAPVPVTLVATSCLGPLHAAVPEKAATLTYRIDPAGKASPDPAAEPLQPALLDRVLRMACEVEDEEFGE
ncbi:hypothetical protein [Actinoplanes sp. NBRC 103695]|uniref:hypothetical protein n=1 Tax=Actinoplanes sp. NBRC 103695 TaxID=3032202 RepID=UPI0024A42DC3|nr:hypothetical protein [Actinoplanes sp. NBRC 103695]GLY93203.1 hypothetical protein Acsp02_04590 [Actinoplanes sp. NBRC 103695]